MQINIDDYWYIGTYKWTWLNIIKGKYEYIQKQNN